MSSCESAKKCSNKQDITSLYTTFFPVNLPFVQHFHIHNIQLSSTTSVNIKPNSTFVYFHHKSIEPPIYIVFEA